MRLRDGQITIRPIAGTRPRGATPEEDRRLEQELINDPKERAEHLMLLDLGRNDVGRVAMLKSKGANEPPTPASRGPRVRVTASFFVERYARVMHLVSNVEGDAPDGLEPVDKPVMAALPAGTLSGARRRCGPWRSSTSWEIEKRGMTYAGSRGLLRLRRQRRHLHRLMRTALFKDGTMYIQAPAAASWPTAIPTRNTTRRSTRLAPCATPPRESWRFI